MFHVKHFPRYAFNLSPLFCFLFFFCSYPAFRSPLLFSSPFISISSFFFAQLSPHSVHEKLCVFSPFQSLSASFFDSFALIFTDFRRIQSILPQFLTDSAPILQKIILNTCNSTDYQDSHVAHFSFNPLFAHALIIIILGNILTFP